MSVLAKFPESYGFQVCEEMESSWFQTILGIWVYLRAEEC